MKVPPKRKGNVTIMGAVALGLVGLNESPSEKEGKLPQHRNRRPGPEASMKVPPKRKGNFLCFSVQLCLNSLNESPSEKEGK